METRRAGPQPKMSPKDTFKQRTETRLPGAALWLNADHPVREQIHYHYIDEPARLNDHQREMSFLRHLMRYDDTKEGHELEDKLNGAERNERSARRAVWLMAVLTGLALAGLGYAAIMLVDFPQNKSQLIIRIFSALGLASVVSLLAFAGYWIISHAVLDDRREECRRLVTRIVESRLGKPAGLSSTEETVRTKFPPSRVAGENPPAINSDQG